MSAVDDRVAAWNPVSIVLEDAALAAAKSDANGVVIAGPGAGKTELLAQRACFLLQTGRCPAPYRILAISFKRDAAENLKRRVVLRCGRDLAARLDSLTYDTFAKDILDRFALSLPVALRPTPDYEVVTGAAAGEARLHGFMLGLSSEILSMDEAHRQAIGPKALRDALTDRPLSWETWPNDLKHIGAAAVWRAMLSASPSRLTFAMISRLAEYLVRENPSIRSALREAYRFVFLDEFQDTTTLQCELTETCFLGSGSVLTAVGDTKQRIMGWAGALRGILGRFKKQYGADEYRLVQNHRSRSRLVEVQSVFAAELDVDAVKVDAAREGDIVGECRVLEFADETREASHLSRLIADLISKDDVVPEEICVLCRAAPGTFAKSLVNGLTVEGIKVVVDVNRREILGEPVSGLLLDCLELLLSDSAPEAWENVAAIASEHRGDEEGEGAARTRRALVAFLASQKDKLPDRKASEEDIRRFLETLLDYLGRDRFAVRHPQYAQGDYLMEVLAGLASLIKVELASNTWKDVPEAVRGVGAVSIMTMHKSKGLEFDTVFFLGLEDRAIWNYDQNKEEETCGLFVALSRAKERCCFTFCRAREGKYGVQAQTRITIKRIFELFAAAGVQVEKIG